MALTVIMIRISLTAWEQKVYKLNNEKRLGNVTTKLLLRLSWTPSVQGSMFEPEPIEDYLYRLCFNVHNNKFGRRMYDH
ncbi:MAG: hypothetical protein ACM3ZS_01015 [Nitrososphaerota archaeon]